VKFKRLVADPQYSSQGLRDVAVSVGTVQVIPYPGNQKTGVDDVLRVDRKFRTYRPQEFKRAYMKRVAVESVFSRLKNLAGLKEHNLRGLAKIAFHSQLCVIAMLLVAQAAVNMHRASKSRSIRYFAN
jgi:transposase